MSLPERLEAQPPTHQPIAVEDRRAILSSNVSQHVRDGYRIEQQNDYQAVLVRGRRPNHLLHLILSIITAGVWALFVWLPITTFGGEKRRMITVDEYGTVSKAKGRG